MVAKELCVRGELETEQNCNILTPSSSGYSSTSFLFCLTGGLGPSSLLRAVSHCLKLQQLSPNFTKLPVAPGYIIVWHPPASCGVTIPLKSTHPRSRLYLDILDRMHLLFTQVHFLFDSLAGVRGQYVTSRHWHHFKDVEDGSADQTITHPPIYMRVWLFIFYLSYIARHHTTKPIKVQQLSCQSVLTV